MILNKVNYRMQFCIYCFKNDLLLDSLEELEVITARRILFNGCLNIKIKVTKLNI